MSITMYNVIPNHILNDLCTRFIINIPDVESQDVIRVFFQVELAHWFYLDFHCPDNAALKPFGLKEFAAQLFNYCPTLTRFNENFDQVFESWKDYKQAVPTYGAILLDPSLQFCLLVQGFWIKSSWGFAKGKVNQDEPPLDCAIREVLEETGFDIRDLIDPCNFLEYKVNEQLCRLYVVPGVPMNTKFQAKTRQEIKSFSWFRVDHLPTHKKDIICKQHLNMNANSFFMVIPFVKELKYRILQMQQQQQLHQLMLTQQNQQKQQHQQQQRIKLINSPPLIVNDTTQHNHNNYKQMHSIELSQTPNSIFKQQKQQYNEKEQLFFESLLKSSEKNRVNRTKSESPSAMITSSPAPPSSSSHPHHQNNSLHKSSSSKHKQATSVTNSITEKASVQKQLVFPVKILQRGDQLTNKFNKNGSTITTTSTANDKNGKESQNHAPNSTTTTSSSCTSNSATQTNQKNSTTTTSSANICEQSPASKSTVKTNNNGNKSLNVSSSSASTRSSGRKIKSTNITTTTAAATTTTATTTAAASTTTTSSTTATTTTTIPQTNKTTDTLPSTNNIEISGIVPTTTITTNHIFTTSTELTSYNFKAPAWSNFKLDVEQLLASMFS